MRVVLVERITPGERSNLDELEALAQTLDYEVVGKLVQSRVPDPAFHIGRGKVVEVAELVKRTRAERVIFTNQLTPSQAFNLYKAIGVEVIDRFQLILEIFAKRAGSPEAKLQVEYARLSYELPRVKERVRSLMSVEQPGLRGRGEYEVDIYFDMIRRRMATLRKKLESLAEVRDQRRVKRRRGGFKLVALAGYTNAGKSTLLNTLTDSSVEVDDRFFTTLTSRTRAIKGSEKILVTDPVGFIDGLPPWLVEAFKATLEDIYFADLVVLVVDGRETLPEILRKLKVSLDILRDHDLRIVVALNKIDVIPSEELERKMEILGKISRPVIPISAKEKINIGGLLEVIRQEVFGSQALCSQ